MVPGGRQMQPGGEALQGLGVLAILRASLE